ncbi:MAG TPA: Rid family detoxifying hydrolase [Saprospiraceae bacterium]|nr:Rid family detoxifying hydrolase [Saprospiraceae bacterium]
MKTPINTSHAPMPIGPYNQAIAAGGMLYISGQVAIDPVSGEMVQDTIEQETSQVLRNISGILQAAGLSFADVVKCSVFVKNIDDFSRINAVYAGFFDGTVAPARELIQVVRLPKDANIEISAIAMMK